MSVGYRAIQIRGAVPLVRLLLTLIEPRVIRLQLLPSEAEAVHRSHTLCRRATTAATDRSCEWSPHLASLSLKRKPVGFTTANLRCWPAGDRWDSDGRRTDPFDPKRAVATVGSYLATKDFDPLEPIRWKYPNTNYFAAACESAPRSPGRKTGQSNVFGRSISIGTNSIGLSCAGKYL
jgi:hypothetical protein